MAGIWCIRCGVMRRACMTRVLFALVRWNGGYAARLIVHVQRRAFLARLGRCGAGEGGRSARPAESACGARRRGLSLGCRRQSPTRFGQLVLADLSVEHQLIERGLDPRDRGRQLFAADEPTAGIVGRRQEGWRRPARASAPSRQGMPRRWTGSSRSARRSTYRRAVAAATRWAIWLFAGSAGPQTMVGWWASTRRASTSASSLGRNV